MNDALLQLEDARDRPVQEATVVGNDAVRLGAAHQILLEPAQHREIEVVRRLIQQAEVGAAEEQAREHEAPALAAAERAGRAIEAYVTEPEARQDAPRLPLGRGRSGRGVCEHLGHGALGRVVRDLGQVRHDQPGVRVDDPAAIGPISARENGEQRALPAAVPADEADSLAARELERGAAEHLLDAKRTTNLMSLQHDVASRAPGVARMRGQGTLRGRPPPPAREASATRRAAGKGNARSIRQ